MYARVRGLSFRGNRDDEAVVVVVLAMVVVRGQGMVIGVAGKRNAVDASTRQESTRAGAH